MKADQVNCLTKKAPDRILQQVFKDLCRTYTKYKKKKLSRNLIKQNFRKSPRNAKIKNNNSFS
jgi:hypothetical protein